MIKVRLYLFIITIALDILVLFLYQPFPIIFDEFAYLFMAETFASGRVCNPPYPNSIFFETFQLIQEPCLIGKFLPLNGLVLSLGLIFNLNPLTGMILVHALACVALHWMVERWFDLKIANWVSILFVLHPNIRMEWVLSYWGGLVPMLGSFLVFGSILKTQSKQFIFFILGALILLASRPFEGSVILAVLFFFLLFYKIIQQKFSKLVSIYLIIGLIFTLLLGAYNHATTGKFYQLPYLVYEQSYAIARPFILQKPIEQISYNHQNMETFYRNEFQATTRRTSNFSNYLDFSFKKLGSYLTFYLTAAFFIFLFFLRKSIFSCKGKLLVSLIFPIYFLGIFPVQFATLHYSAPFAGLIFLFLGFGFKGLTEAKLKKPLRNFLVVIFVCCFTAEQFYYIRRNLNIRSHGTTAHINQQLAKLSTNQQEDLVFFKYGKRYNPALDSVYNSPNLDSQDVIRARYISPNKNQQLINYYPARKVWILEIDTEIILNEYNN